MVKRYESIGVETANWFDYADAYADMAAAVPAVGVVVELGVWKGRSLVYLWELLWGKHGAENMPRVVGVDRFCNHEKFGLWQGDVDCSDGVIASIHAACHEAPPEIIVELSYEAARHFSGNSVAAVWIDAAHDVQSVCADIAAWLPKLVPGGWLGGHDLNSHAGVRAALRTMGLDYDDRGRWWKWTGKWKS